MRRLLPIFLIPMVVLSLPGCSTAYDPPPQASKPVPAGVESWTKIPRRNWGSVSYDKREEALSLMGAKDAIPLRDEQYEKLREVPTGWSQPAPVETPAGSKLYLVRGRGYGDGGARMRFNRKTGELSVFLVAYNGEIFFPGMRWAVGDIPVIIALPQLPSKVHKSAEIGGDSVSRFMDQD